jgi:hypothetical protein
MIFEDTLPGEWLDSVVFSPGTDDIPIVDVHYLFLFPHTNICLHLILLKLLLVKISMNERRNYENCSARQLYAKQLCYEVKQLAA